MNDSSTLNVLADILSGFSFAITCEEDLQVGVGRALERAGVVAERERKLGRDRVDFFVDGIAVEVKIEGSLSAVTRQLHRYSEHPDVKAVLLVTTKMQHDRMPETMSGKPVRVVRVKTGAI